MLLFVTIIRSYLHYGEVCLHNIHVGSQEIHLHNKRTNDNFMVGIGDVEGQMKIGSLGFFVFNSISTFMSYFMPKPSL